MIFLPLNRNSFACPKYDFRSRLKSKHESELREVETEVRSLREKICKVREDAAAAEEANIVLRAENRQKDVELDEVKKVRGDPNPISTFAERGGRMAHKCICDFFHSFIALVLLSIESFKAGARA